ncbi:MAG: DEAD/DEAH box helicase [Mariprofundaceae bacterium]
MYDRKALEQAFPPNYINEASRLRLDGRIHDVVIEEDGQWIVGRVDDTYKVDARVEQNTSGRLRVDGECNCNDGYNCRHVVAVLLEAIEGASAEADLDLPLPVKAWLDQLQALLRQSKIAMGQGASDSQFQSVLHPSCSDGAQLLYILGINDLGEPAMKLEIARNLKHGGYGKGTPILLCKATLIAPQRFSLDYNLYILEQLIKQPRNSNKKFPILLTGEKGSVLLQMILATGRCHWQGKDSKALLAGEHRHASLRWHADEKGVQRLAPEGNTNYQLLEMVPPWYLTFDDDKCGSLATDYATAISVHLLKAPSIAPEYAATFSEALQELSADMPLPTSFKVSDQTVSTGPMAHITLSTIQHDFVGSEQNILPLELAELSIVYDKTRIALDDSRQTIQSMMDGQISLVHRQLDRERHYVKQMRRLGFAPLHEVEPATTVRGVGRYGMFDEESWGSFMCNELPKLREQGWLVDVQDNFRFQLTDCDHWYIRLNEDAEKGEFAIELGLEHEGHHVNLMPFVTKLLKQADEKGIDEESAHYSLPDGRILPLSKDTLQQINAALTELKNDANLNEKGQLMMPRMQASCIADLEKAIGSERINWHGAEPIRSLERRMQPKSIQKVKSPKGFKATLRGYQQDGLDWLQFLRRNEFGGILADDMGLGKTIQVLAHLLVEKHSGRMILPSLIIAPTSLMQNWRRETERFAPQLSVLILHGSHRHAGFSEIERYDLVLSTYPLLCRDEDMLLAHQYHYLILDEAQLIKNPGAQANRIVRQVEAKHRLCMTGTPMENHLGELWSLFRFLMPDLLGGKEMFKRRYRTPIERDQDQHSRKALARRIAPFMLRRTKQKVATDLPMKSEFVRSIPLTDKQRQLYNAIRGSMQQKVSSEIGENGISRSQIIILDALMKLRQTCCDPRLYDPEIYEKEDSSKITTLMEMLPEMIEEGRKVLLFSQFTSMLSLIEASLDEHGIDYVKLTGQTRNRQQVIDRFQGGEVPLFLISLKAGGIGLNLTAADTVIHYDPWWNPAVEDQATDRAYRIGQNKPVFVYRLITDGTVEERISLMQVRKRELAEGIYGDGGIGAIKWSAEDLDYLFAPIES